MNKSPLNISGPYTHENLTFFLLHGPDELDGSHYVPLREAMDEKHVIVYETGNVGELEAENLMLIKMNPIKQQFYKKKINQIIHKKIQTKGKEQQLKI